jgi:hypothetical protein
VPRPHRETEKDEIIDNRADIFYHLLLDITACGCGRKVTAIFKLCFFFFLLC